VNDDVDLSAVAADAALLDALAAGSLAADGAAGLAGLVRLRSAVDSDLQAALDPPAPSSTAGTVVALRRPTQRAGRATAVAAGVVLALTSSGMAAATYDAHPGDPLYGLRTAVAGPRAEDPRLLDQRLDAVQRRLEQADGDAAATQEAGRVLAEVQALIAQLDPELRTSLAARHAALQERLVAAATPSAATNTPRPGRPAAPPTPPAAPPALQSEPGDPGTEDEAVRDEAPPAAVPGPGGPPDSGPGTANPQRPADTTPEEPAEGSDPEQDETTPEGGRPPQDAGPPEGAPPRNGDDDGAEATDPVRPRDGPPSSSVRH
jgi:hypothetical protein